MNKSDNIARPSDKPVLPGEMHGGQVVKTPPPKPPETGQSKPDKG